MDIFTVPSSLLKRHRVLVQQYVGRSLAAAAPGDEVDLNEIVSSQELHERGTKFAVDLCGQLRTFARAGHCRCPDVWLSIACQEKELRCELAEDGRSEQSSLI